MNHYSNLTNRWPRARALLLLVADLTCFACAWVIATWLASVFGRAQWNDWFPATTLAGQIFTVMALLVVLYLLASGQYTRRSSFWEETAVAWRTIGLAAVASFAVNFFVQVSNARVVALLAWSVGFVLLPVGRILAREWMIPRGHWHRKALVVGDGANARAARDALSRERHMGVVIAGMVTLDGDRVCDGLNDGDDFSGIPMHLLNENVESVAQQLGCEVIVVAMDDQAPERAALLVRSLHAQRFEVFVVPALGGMPVHGLQAQHFFSNDVLFLRLQYRLLSPLSRWLKRTMDIVGSATLLAALFPLMAWVVWRIWREDGRPFLYTQSRLGADGHDFRFIKFRSMSVDADAKLESWKTQQPDLYQRYAESNFKLSNDPRVLTVGRLIRRASIDELPQLWNVLRGDMSLVGPRPLLRREMSMYPVEAMELYLQVKPGITGLWQVSGRSQTTFQDRAAYDSWYVRNWSLWVDVVILLKTVRVVLTARGAM